MENDCIDISSGFNVKKAKTLYYLLFLLYVS